MSYMCTLRIKSKQTSYRKERLDVVWGKCALNIVGLQMMIIQVDERFR